MKLKYLFLLVASGLVLPVFSQLRQVKISNCEINYVDRGEGVPIVFVHGAMEDYRTWDPQLDSFSKQFRIITYSRRFNYPNQNKNAIKNFSAETEASDLAELITQLKLGAVHLVGHSYGGLIAMFVAKKNPWMVRSLTLSEPGIISWLPGLPGGKKLYDDFDFKLWKPVKQAFEVKDTAAVLRHTFVYFYGSDMSDSLPPEVLSQIIANIPEWHAIAYSPNAFPDFDKKDVQNFKVPVLLMSAGKTLPLLELINNELKRLLPKAQQFHLAEGTHDYWFTHSKQMGEALMTFIKSISKN